MLNIKEITVSVGRTLNDEHGSVIYSCSARTEVAEHQCPAIVWSETLAFCQDKIAKEIQRIINGEPPKPSTNVYNEDYVPDFNPFVS